MQAEQVEQLLGGWRYAARLPRLLASSWRGDPPQATRWPAVGRRQPAAPGLLPPSARFGPSN